MHLHCMFIELSSCLKPEVAVTVTSLHDRALLTDQPVTTALLLIATHRQNNTLKMLMGTYTSLTSKQHPLHYGLK